MTALAFAASSEFDANSLVNIFREVENSLATRFVGILSCLGPAHGSFYVGAPAPPSSCTTTLLHEFI